MPQELVIRPAGAMHSLVPPQHVAETLRALSNQLEGQAPYQTISALPTVAQRSRLIERQKQVRSLVTPASESVAAQSRIAAAVGRMLGGWLNLKVGNVAETIAGFTDALQPLPGWAVELACEDFREGKATEMVLGVERKLSPDFAPSAARVFAVARAKLTDLYAEGALIDKLLTVKISPPTVSRTEQDEVAIMMADLSAKMGVMLDADRKREAAAARKLADEARARVAQFAADADRRRLARFNEAGLQPIYVNGRICDLDALPPDMQVRIDRDQDDVRDV